jgi:cytochrome c-type biogenesis protein CcmH/NrfG
MSATTLTAPVAVSTPNKLRYALAAVAVAVLLLVAFAIGRWTSEASADEPAATTIPATAPVSVAPSVDVPCNVGHPC